MRCKNREYLNLHTERRQRRRKKIKIRIRRRKYSRRKRRVREGVRAWQWRLETGSHISRIDILQVRPRRSFFPYVDERESRPRRPSHTEHPPHVLQCPFSTPSLHLRGPPGALVRSGMRADSSVTFIGSKSRGKRTFGVS